MELSIIEPSDKKLDTGLNSSILNHAYQFSIWEYDILIMYEDNSMAEKYNLIIWNEGKADKTPPYVVTTLAVLFILSDKHWAIQAMNF